MPELIYLNDSLESTVDRILADNELQGCGLGKRKITRTLKSFQGDEIACSVFLKKYALREEEGKIIEFTLDEAKDRWAEHVASAEKEFPRTGRKRKEYFRELYEYFLPAGRQMFALGNKYVKKATLTNCYVTKIEEDSIEGIYDAAKRIARTYSYGGGIGLCIGELRPARATVSNSARFSTGAVSFMELYSMTTGLIGQKGRRAALMITCPVGHPDIEDFVEIKHNNVDKVKYANLSIKLTDEFMEAVVSDSDFILKFVTKHEVIERSIRARDLWVKIIQSARDSAEPGLLFWDRAVEMSPSDTYESMKIHSTNPCAEQFMDSGSACVLGSMLLHKFVINPFTENAEFDFKLFGEFVARGVRHLDNIVELNFTKHGLEEQENSARDGRRIGLGLTGLADMFAALRIKYDSKEAIEFADKLMNFKKICEYGASIELAKIRGSFPLYNPEIHFSRGFCATLPDEIKEKAMVFGLRNVAISTIAPNGSLSIIAQCSSGGEPIFAFSYIRNVMLGENEKKEFTINHQGVSRFFVVTGETKLPEYWVSAHEIDYKHRIKLQGVLQKHIDASISSTINLPRDADAEVVGQIYFDAWKEGLKGITVYREGSREGILISDEFAKQAGIPNMDSVIYCVRAEGGDKFYIMISYKNKDIRDPYQVFVMNYKKTETDSFVKTGNALVKMLAQNGVCEKRIQKYADRSINSLAKITRFLSLSMKTDNLENALSVLDENAYVGTIAAKLNQILQKSVSARSFTCPRCESSNVKMEEGCVSCIDCQWSGCN
jgi:ribonucleoside-diphosphate reductase alpha chain